MNTLTESELQLIENAALALGYVPSRYTVRDSTVIYVSVNGSGSRYWNPLDAGRHDFFDVLTYLSRHSVEVVAEHRGDSIPGVYAAVHYDALKAPLAAVAASEQYSIPKAFLCGPDAGCAEISQRGKQAMTHFNSIPLSTDEQAAYLKMTNQAVEDPEAEGAKLCPDWADSLTNARVALRKLDDAFPGSDAQKAVQAHKQLVDAANGLRMFLLLRGVETLA